MMSLLVGAVTPAQLAVVENACDYIQRNLEKKLTLAALGKEVGVSPFHFQRVFRRVMGISPRRYVEECRLGRVKEHLREGRPVRSALYSSGYGSTSRLYGGSKGKLAMSPATYRDGGRGTRVHYTIGASPIGKVLVAATENGICGIILGEDTQELESSISREFPRAAVSRADDELKTTFGAVLGYLEGQQSSLRLDVKGTEFQRKVWGALRTIPYGTTCSYGEVAALVGRPTAARAVARACATNPVPLLIPCHRVVRKDGDVGGYRFGVRRKEALLERERKVAAKASAARAIVA